MAKIRNHKYDNIKAFLIFAVVLGHALSKFGNTVETNTLYKIIFSFHMPAFLFVSGYFAKYNPKRVLSKLVPLYVIFQLIQLFSKPVISLVQTGVWKAPHIQFFKPEWTLWYMFAMIVYQLMIPVFDTKETRYRIGYMTAAFACGLLMGLNPDTDNFMAMSRIFVFLPFFMAGYYEKDGQFITKTSQGSRGIIGKIVSLVLTLATVAAIVVNTRIMPAKIFFGKEPYDGSVVTWYTRILAWIFAFIWIWFIVSWFPDKEIKGIGTIGTNTLPVYLLHSICLLIMVNIPVLVRIGANSILFVVIVSLVLTFVLSRNVFEKALRKIQIPLK